MDLESEDDTTCQDAAPLDTMLNGSFNLVQFPRDTNDSIHELKELLASANHDHKQDIATT
jgi:hypothetical protein